MVLNKKIRVMNILIEKLKQGLGAAKQIKNGTFDPIYITDTNLLMTSDGAKFTTKVNRFTNSVYMSVVRFYANSR